MVKRIALCTDDTEIAHAVDRLFGNLADICVYERKTMDRESPSLSQYDSFVLGVTSPVESDWLLCRKVVAEIKMPVYLMLRRSPSLADQKRAEHVGIQEILLDPFSKLRDMAGKETELLSVLKATVEDGPPNDPDLQYLGCDVYFHIKEYWAGSAEKKNQLSERETKLLKLFLANKGEIVSTDEIADAVWDGHIEKNSVRKSIKRLREKLEDAKELIQGRKQGGYIYRGEEE